MYQGAVSRPTDLPHPLFHPPRDPRRAVGAAVSILFHLALFVLVVRGTVDEFMKYEARGAPGLLPGGGGGGGGGQGSRYISLPPLPPSRATDVAKQNAVPPPAIVPTIPQPVAPEATPVVVAAPKDSQPAATSATEPTGNAPGTGPGSGGGSGGGVGGGVGPGVGPGSGPGTGGGGAGGTGREPQWTYGTFFFEKPPKELRGQTLRVTFYVQADGRVARVETDPEIKDGEFAKRFNERALTYRFRPARNADGVAVPGVTTINFTLPSK